MKNLFMNHRSVKSLVFAIALVAAASCKKGSNNNGGSSASITAKIDSAGVTTGAAEGLNYTGANTDDTYTSTDFPTTVSIAFFPGGATVTPAIANGVTITQTGGNVVVTATGSGIQYMVSGSTSNGSLKIYSDKKFLVTLNNATIINLTGPAVNIQSKKRAFISVADGTTNTLSDGATYASSTEDQKGTIFSEGQIVFGGTGTLKVSGNYKHAICSDDYVRIVSGNININRSVSDGIHTNNAVFVDGGTINITAGSDGIEAEAGNIIINGGNLNITSGGKGIRTSYTGTDGSIARYIVINGGNINVKSTTDEGISSKGSLTINKGNISSFASDDAFKADSAIYVNGGYVFANSTANDGMDSNGIFDLNGGTVVAIGAPVTESGIDCDDRQFKITGGQLIATGGSTSAPSATSTINSVVLGAGTAQIIHIQSTTGTEALTFQAPATYATLVFASAKLKSATAYIVYTGGSVNSPVNFRGLFTGGTYKAGTKTSTTFTTGSVVTKVGGIIATN